MRAWAWNGGYWTLHTMLRHTGPRHACAAAATRTGTQASLPRGAQHAGRTQRAGGTACMQACVRGGGHSMHACIHACMHACMPRGATAWWPGKNRCMPHSGHMPDATPRPLVAPGSSPVLWGPKASRVVGVQPGQLWLIQVHASACRGRGSRGASLRGKASGGQASGARHRGGRNSRAELFMLTWRGGQVALASINGFIDGCSINGFIDGCSITGFIDGCSITGCSITGCSITGCTAQAGQGTASSTLACMPALMASCMPPHVHLQHVSWVLRHAVPSFSVMRCPPSVSCGQTPPSARGPWTLDSATSAKWPPPPSQGEPEALGGGAWGLVVSQGVCRACQEHLMGLQHVAEHHKAIPSQVGHPGGLCLEGKWGNLGQGGAGQLATESQAEMDVGGAGQVCGIWRMQNTVACRE